jgi:2',3'-cyclic-nucleotide 2'-phosphodiesterase (5'-nucleotidase family)
MPVFARWTTPSAPRGLAALVALALLTMTSGLMAQTARVTFILVNDIYQMSEQAMPDGKRRGGFARLAAVVRAERAKGGHVILAHAGDTLSPSLMSGIDQGRHIIDLTNMVAPDIFVPGNHEFDFGKEVFLQRMAEATFPRFAANLRGADGRQLPGFTDQAIVTLDGVRIGLTGTTYDDSRRVSEPGDLVLLPALPTMHSRVEALRSEGADFVVAVMHATREQGYDLLHSRVADLILTGHTHDLLVNYDGRGALVESSHDAHYVTAVDVAIEVTMQEGVRTTTWWPQFRIIDTATVTPDAEVAAVVSGYEQTLSRGLDTAIGTTAVELDSRSSAVRSRETAIGNLIADAMRAGTDADAAVMNGGGIRSGRIYPPGAGITRRDILAELPFGNRVVTLELRGADLKLALENGLSRLPAPSGRFPQVSGLLIEADASRPAGERIVSLSVNGEPLDDSRTYRVATNDFLARGGDGYDSFRDADALLPPADSPLLATEVIEHVQSLGTIRTGVEGRIRLK